MLGLTLRGMQVYQVRACVSVLLMQSVVCVNTYAHESESAFAQKVSLCICGAIKPLTRRVRNVWDCHQQQCSRR